MAEGQAGAEFVFVTSAGTPFRKSNLIRQSFKPLLKAVDAARAEEAAASHPNLEVGSRWCRECLEEMTTGKIPLAKGGRPKRRGPKNFGGIGALSASQQSAARRKNGDGSRPGYHV